MNINGRHAILKLKLLAGIMVFMVLPSPAQISPGQLTSAHAHLEGISNCTKCHVLGDKVSNDKCLDCHREIKTGLDQKKGYHASAEVIGKDCFICHSEHHGRQFEIVRFDEDRFNHNLTGFKLTGAHLLTDCRSCHSPENIESPDLKKKKNTYLGLKTECISCHSDVHRNTLSTNCASCHNTTNFAPATLFDHAKTDFPLRGKHRTVDCRSCHQDVASADKQNIVFSGIPFNSCADCHNDVHNNKLGRNCKECHTEESFNQFAGRSYDHSKTDFPLAGKHRTLDCASCHQMGSSIAAVNLFQDYNAINFRNCIACHVDVHETRFGTDCRQCHTEESFTRIRNLDKFDHDLTDFPLEGKHEMVDCRNCHDRKLTDPVPHQACMDCHADYHKGEFVRGSLVPDCRECHTVHGFEGSTFTIARHQETDFPLTGAHLATPCYACHVQEDQWTFNNLGKTCHDCHRDVHAGKMDEKYYPGKTCYQCHSTESWSLITFDHACTGFELRGQHGKITCTDCHIPETVASGITVPFSGLTSTCVSCHDNVHGNQFEVNGETDCVRCHGYMAWSPSEFDHSTARFKLDGAHQKVACEKCHMPERDVDGMVRIRYRTGKLECIECHL